MNKFRRIIEMTENEFQDMLFNTMKGVVRTFYKGISQRYLDRFEDDISRIIDVLDYLRLSAQTKVSKKQKQSKPKQVEDEPFKNTLFSYVSEPEMEVFEKMHSTKPRKDGDI